ncbi:MAG: ABC transporter permease subunit [Clostridia bacterium]|nr:ABC transporter permease subunit [Clostridia bacterium]
MKKNNYIFKITMYLLIFLLISPLVILVIWSFVRIWPWPNLLPRDYGLRGFKHVLDPSTKSLRVLFLSVGLSSLVTLCTLLISIPAAKALGVYEFRGKGFFKMLILAPIIVPPVAVAMGIHIAFIKLGLANTFLGVVFVHLVPCIPYAVRILTNVFEIIGESMEMQARVLGASPLQTFIKITLPLMAPGLLSAGSLVFIVSLSQYFLTFLIGGGRIITLPMLMFPYIQSGDRMMASTYSIIFIVTALIMLLIMERIVRNYYKEQNYFYI